MLLSVIFTTYNSPDWLQKTVWGYWNQHFTDFEIIIADDGSGAETRELVARLQRESPVPINHVWHEDNGFRKCEILNKAIVAAKTDYLVFTDGDCIPHRDFLKVHAEERQKGCFLSGGYFKLPMDISKLVTQDDIESGRCFELKWLKRHGLPSSFKNTKLFFNKGFAAVMNAVTPTNASWNGHNSSGWKEDIIAVNGYNEEMKYGALDRELGERLMNNGIKAKQIRYSAVCLHLDHSRSYKNQKDMDHNKAIRASVKKEKITRASEGIDKYIVQ